MSHKTPPLASFANLATWVDEGYATVALPKITASVLCLDSEQCVAQGDTLVAMFKPKHEGALPGKTLLHAAVKIGDRSEGLNIQGNKHYTQVAHPSSLAAKKEQGCAR